MKILSVFGTRPEGIKIAPVINCLNRYSNQITSIVCVTAQHREMLDQVLSVFNIKTDYDLNLMKKGQSLAEITANILIGLNTILSEEKPDWVLTQGDTTTAMAASLAAFYHQIKVAHIEAGLRTANKFHPFPEEVNRKIADIVCDLHFAPTESARANLIDEGINEASIVVTGNTVIDALVDVAEREYDWSDGPLASIPRNKRLILVTAHRREHFGEPLEQICAALISIAAKYSDIHVVYPVHLNPNIKRIVYERLSDIPNISLLGPIEYLPFVQLLKTSFLVLTDSGGLQEEAPGLGKPVLLLRKVTERREGIDAGAVKIVGPDKQNIIVEMTRLLDNRAAYDLMSRAINLYGDGQASRRIVERLLLETLIPNP